MLYLPSRALQTCFLTGCLSLGLVGCGDTVKATPLQVVGSPAGPGAAEPYLFSDPAGTVYLSWLETQGTAATLKLSHWDQERWTVPVTVASGNEWFVNWADYPSVISDGQGKLMLHWLEYSAPGTYTYDVKITTSSDGRTWSSPVVLNEDGKKAEHGFVSMAPWGDKVLVTWLDGRNMADTGDDTAPSDAMTLRAAVLDYAGNKQDEWELDDRVCDCCQTSAAITDQGPVVIYRNRTTAEVRDIAITRWVQGSWTAPVAIHDDDWTIDGCPVNGPRSEALGNTLAVAWFTMAEEQPVVKVVFSQDAGATFGEPFIVSGPGSTGRVDLVLLDDSSALVSWTEGTSIRIAKVHADGRQEPAINVEQFTTAHASGFPQMAKSGGAVLMAWADDESQTIITVKVNL